MNPALFASPCDNCGQLLRECQRNWPVGDTRLPVSLRGQPCDNIVPILSGKQMEDRHVWAMLNQTSPHTLPRIAVCYPRNSYQPNQQTW